jgi:hypothetical protein
MHLVKHINHWDIYLFGRIKAALCGGVEEAS